MSDAKHWSLDYNAEPAAPWNEWDDYGGCWVCNWCGAAAGFGIHAPTCKRAAQQASDGKDETAEDNP